MSTLYWELAILTAFAGLVLFGIFLWKAMFSYKEESSDLDENIAELHAMDSIYHTTLSANHAAAPLDAQINLSDKLLQRIIQKIGVEPTILEAMALARTRLLAIPTSIDLAKKADKRRLTEQEHQHVLDDASFANTKMVLDKATAMGLDPVTYPEVQKRMLLDKQELVKRWEEFMQDLDSSFMYEEVEYQKLYIQLRHIAALHRKSETLPEGRTKILLEKHITFMENNFHERQQVLQSKTQKESQGSFEDTDFGGDEEEDT